MKTFPSWTAFLVAQDGWLYRLPKEGRQYISTQSLWNNICCGLRSYLKTSCCQLCFSYSVAVRFVLGISPQKCCTGGHRDIVVWQNPHGSWISWKRHSRSPLPCCNFSPLPSLGIYLTLYVSHLIFKKF